MVLCENFRHLVLSRLLCHGVSSLFQDGKDEAQLVFRTLFLFAFLVIGHIVPHGAILQERILGSQQVGLGVYHGRIEHPVFFPIGSGE